MEYSKILKQITMKRLFSKMELLYSKTMEFLNLMVIYEYWADSLWCIDMRAVCFWYSF